MTTRDQRRTSPLPTVGIIGGGQLARMTIQAAIPLAIPIRLLAASPDDGGAKVAHDVTIGSPDDPDAVAAFAAGCDVVTFDHELVPPAVLDRLDAEGVTLAPSSATMRIAQNKRRQRELFAAAGLWQQPRFAIARTAEEAVAHSDVIGLPVVLKAATGGYDGRGVWVCDDRAEVERVASELAARGIEILVEERLEIDSEHAVLVARSASGEVVTYPLVETEQVDGICREISASVFVDEGEAHETAAIGRRVAELTDVVGIMAVELFAVYGLFYINEIATRPHNSGHWTIEGSTTSQFEQHLRAVTGLPLGSTAMTADWVSTVNVLGPSDGSDPAERLSDALRIEGAHIHLYGKSARPGRKLGHVTVTDDDVWRHLRTAWSAVEVLTGEPRPEGMRSPTERPQEGMR